MNVVLEIPAPLPGDRGYVRFLETRWHMERDGPSFNLAAAIDRKLRCGTAEREVLRKRFLNAAEKALGIQPSAVPKCSASDINLKAWELFCEEYKTTDDD